jgi:hypothetical protein
VVDARGNMKEGFWIRFWIEYGRGHIKKDETYKFIKYEDGYTEKDEESLKLLAEDWCQYDKRGCDIERYSYGFEVVSKPPGCWLKEELERLRNKHEKIIHQENLIKSELEIE